MNFRGRLLAAVDSGSSCGAAAARFGVAPSNGGPLAGTAARDG